MFLYFFKMLRKYQRNSSILMLLTVRDIKTIFFEENDINHMIFLAIQIDYIIVSKKIKREKKFKIEIL